jgi:chaperone required for assembly of F1-ATPase
MPSHADLIDKPRRFYKAVSVEPEAGGFEVRLDGRAARSPGRARLRLPTAALAELLAEEWAAQDPWIDTASMPATRLAFTALDRTPQARGAVAEEVSRYAGSDLLCYFAEEPPALLEREVAHWGPVLDWAEAELGLSFERATGIVHRPQPAETVARAAALAAKLDDFALTGLAFAAALLGSAVLAFALQRGELSGEAVFDLSRLDEAFQEERWGVDQEAAERTAALRREALMLERWFAALRG